MAQVVHCTQPFFYNQTQSCVLAVPKVIQYFNWNQLDLLCNPHRREAWDPKSMTSEQPELQCTIDAYPLYLTTDRPSVVGLPVLLIETVLDVGEECYQPW